MGASSTSLQNGQALPPAQLSGTFGKPVGVPMVLIRAFL
jgi:hypothetical protein